MRFNRKRQCERFLSTAELVRLGSVLSEARASDDVARKVVATAITILLLTGYRSSEILKLHWPEVRGYRLNLLDSKIGPRTVWLGDEVRALISTLPRHAGIPWIFWNARVERPFKTIEYYCYELRKHAQLPGVRIHDLRHTFASRAAMNKETLPMIGRLFGHVNPLSTARYAHLDDEHVLDAAQQLGDAIELMMGR